MCDMCGPSGDHDKPYRFGATRELLYRFTRDELDVLSELRHHVADVRAGYEHGPAFGDLSTDDPSCPDCGQPMHIHEPLGWCCGGA